MVVHQHFWRVRVKSKHFLLGLGSLGVICCAAMYYVSFALIRTPPSELLSETGITLVWSKHRLFGSHVTAVLISAEPSRSTAAIDLLLKYDICRSARYVEFDHVMIDSRWAKTISKCHDAAVVRFNACDFNKMQSTPLPHPDSRTLYINDCILNKAALEWVSGWRCLSVVVLFNTVGDSAMLVELATSGKLDAMELSDSSGDLALLDSIMESGSHPQMTVHIHRSKNIAEAVRIKRLYPKVAVQLNAAK